MIKSIKYNKWKAIFCHMLIRMLLWILITYFIQAFKCPEMTETELFINIPKNFVCNWQNCN